MDTKPATFTPFPKNSVNLVTGPTSIGKTYFITHILNNHKVYFPSVNRIVIVVCNENVEFVSLSPDIDVDVVQLPLIDFDPQELEEDDVVVIDDVQNLNENIRTTISVGTHHKHLASLFIVTHSLLRNKNYELLSLVHRVFLFLRAASNAKLTKYILRDFFPDPEIRLYLQNHVLNYCLKLKQVLCLELNPIVSHPESANFLGFSHLDQLSTKQFCLLYPAMNLSVDSTFAQELPIDNVPPGTFVAVPAQVIVQQKVTAKNQEVCSDETTWNKTMREIEDNIEGYFKSHKHRQCKNLAKEILQHPKMCVTTDGRFFHLKDRPRTKVSMIDFIALATRRAAPMEVSRKSFWSNYSLLVDELLKNNAPLELFTNRLLLPKRFNK
jgi:hypothetical protein